MTRGALLVAALGAAWLLTPTAAQADAATGFSLGGGVGRYNIRINNATAFKNTVSNYSKNDTAYQFFAKWRFAPFFALEGQYMNLGTNRSFIAPGTQYTADIAKAINLFGWQGKVFDAQGKTLKNRILISGIEAIVAEVYKAPSWVDGKECIVLDYSKTSVVAQRIRDEIRQIAPGTYLGVVFWGKKRLIDFALHF